MDNDKDFIHEDFDSSDEVATTDFKSANEKRKGIVSGFRERIRQYRSPEAKQARRQKTLEKRDRQIEDLTHKAKKEKLKSSIRRSRNIAKPDFSMSMTPRSSTTRKGRSRPKDNLDDVFGFGHGTFTKSSKSKKRNKDWSGMDRMFGIKK